MRRTTLGILIAALALAGAMVYARQQSSADLEKSRQPEPRLTQQPGSLQPDRESPNWKELADDLGVWVYRDPLGKLRGRVFVRHDERWVPVAIDGLADIPAGAVPAR